MVSTRRPRLPLVVYVLGLAAFGLGTSEFMIVGLVPEIAADLDESIPRTGLLISAFAGAMAVGAPVAAVATLRLPRRSTLLGTCAVFTAGHVAAALAPTYETLLALRIVTAAASGAILPLAIVVATRSAPATPARAVAVISAGFTLANIAGAPAGTWLGHAFDWRMSFWAVAALSLATTVAAAGLVRRDDGQGGDVPAIGAEIHAFRSPPLWLTLTTTVAFQASMYATLTFVAPLLTGVSGVDPGDVAVVLSLFGVGGLLGAMLAGRLADRDLLAGLRTGLLVLTGVVIALAMAAEVAAGAVAALMALGAAGFWVATTLNARAVTLAGAAPTLAAAATVSAFNVGTSLGPWVAGLTLTAGWGYVAPVWTAAVLASIGLALAVTSGRRERRASAASAS